MKLNHRNRRRGQVLIMTAFLIFVLFTLALSFFKLVPTELNSALRTKQALTAQVIADSGIKEAKVWIESQPPQKILTQDILDTEFNAGAEGDPIELNDRWRYTVRLEANVSGPYAFDAVSTCFFDGEPMRQARATLARENFSRYALFIDQWESSLLMQASPGAIQGPFHTNDFFRLVIPNDFYANGGDPFVSGVDGGMTHAGTTSEGTLPFVDTTGDGNAYHDTSNPVGNTSSSAVPYDEDGEIESRYDSLVSGGRSNLTATDHVTLPYSADELLVQSLGGADASSTAIPTDIGMYIANDGSQVQGGIFLVGDVDMRLSLDANGDQVHTFTQVIPEEAYRYTTQEPYQHSIYGNVSRTLSLGSRYYQSSSVVQSVGTQQVVGYETETRTTTRRVQTGQVWVGGSGTTVGSWQPTYETVVETSEVQVPIYDTVFEDRTTTVQNEVVITDPNDPMIGSTVSSYEKIGEETRMRPVDHVISADQFEANPAAYPDAIRFFTTGNPKTATVTEVSGAAPKTRVVDYEGQSFEFDGGLNGVTFVDGSVKSLEGISKGAHDPAFPDGDTYQGRYIVANPAFSSKGEMTITDDILQFYDGDDSSLRGVTPNTLKIGELSPNGQHALGLVSRETFLRPDRNDPLNLYAVMLSGHSIRDSEDENGIPQVAGGFGSDPSIMENGYGFNSFNLYGGLVQANQRLWNQGGDGLTGNFRYDPAVAGDMPRFPRSNRVTTLRYADRYVDDQDSI